METNRLKTFAQQTRRKLIELVTAKLHTVLTTDSVELRSRDKDIKTIREKIITDGEKSVVEEVAYTWFNRFMALRFMDANDYNDVLVVTPVEGGIRPAILDSALSGNLADNLNITQSEISDILSDRAHLSDAQNLLYRRLLVAKCNQLGELMPFLFERISDYTELLLPDDLLSEKSIVADIRNGMTVEDCKQEELIGWLYQFYITDRKADAEEKKGRKGGLKSDEQAAATQLFTPHWIVRYMVENTIGRIWMKLHPNSELKNSMPYYIAPLDGEEVPIPEHIHSAKDITFMDPCVGSGHVLVYAFTLFAMMYEEEGVEKKLIPNMILENNLFGVDIDKRCYQLASFALTMKARAYSRRYFRDPKAPHVLWIQKFDHDVIADAGSWDDKSEMWNFQNADTIGSLLNVDRKDYENITIPNNFFHNQVMELKKEADFLSRKYDCVVTNPPYLGKGMCEPLKKYVAKKYPDSKSDTMAAFIEKGLHSLNAAGLLSMINQQQWLFISSYKILRKKIISNCHIDSLLHLGTNVFPEINGEVVQNVSFVMTNKNRTSLGKFYDLTGGSNSLAKEQLFLSTEVDNVTYYVHIADFNSLPNCNFSYWANNSIKEIFKDGNTIDSLGDTRKGMATGMNDKFVRVWTELSIDSIGRGYDREGAFNSGKKWFPYVNGGGRKKWYGNFVDTVLWENDGEQLKTEKVEDGSRVRAVNLNLNYIFRSGICWASISTSSRTFRYFPKGCLFSSASNAWFGNSEVFVLSLLNSKVSKSLLHIINPSQNANPGDIGHIPVRQENTEIISEIAKNCIKISRADWDCRELSMDYQQNELLRLKSDDMISSAYESFKNIWSKNFYQLLNNEEELNRKFIDIYELQNELTPDVPLDEITILDKEKEIVDGKLTFKKDVVIKQFISYLVGCFMGRYSVDKPGLILTNQGETLEDYLRQVPSPTIAVDDDAIIPILDDGFDYFADEMTTRIKDAVRTLFGETHYKENLDFIENAIGDIRMYMAKNFYTDHCQMYQKRPIYWMFCSDPKHKPAKSTFRCLVYMHRMRQDTISKILADYLQPMIRNMEQEKQRQDEKVLNANLSDKERNKAQKVVDNLHKRLIELREYERKMVNLSTQRITINLDDGVKYNYALFKDVLASI